MTFDFALQNIGIVHSDQTYEYNNIFNYTCRILLVRQGSGIIRCGNEEHDIVPDHLYLVPPLITHSIQCTSPTILQVLTFTDQSLHIYDHFHLFHYTLEIPAPSGTLQLLDTIVKAAPNFTLTDLSKLRYDTSTDNTRRIKEFRNLPASNQMIISGLLHVILAQFMDKNAPAASVSDIRISKAVWQINRDLANTPSLDDMSAKACLNKNTFIRLFRLQTGFTPTDYIIHRRMLRAQFLFISGNRSVKEVAHMVGYDNISYFGRTFKKAVGMSPLHFIQQNG
ncbi:MAG: AraC family transcriptional regulator [Bacteroidaceae bacterium]|nr:AraC family transcriptional regulator [Bacteroidaceae bacterium]